MYVCVCKWMQLHCKCAGTDVYKRCEIPSPENVQFPLKKDVLIQNVEHIATHGLLSIYLVKPEVKPYTSFVQS